MKALTPRLASVLALADGTKTPQQIARALGMSDANVRCSLYALRRKGIPAQCAHKYLRHTEASRAKISASMLPACLPAAKRDDYRLLKRKGYSRRDALRALGIVPQT